MLHLARGRDHDYGRIRHADYRPVDQHHECGRYDARNVDHADCGRVVSVSALVSTDAVGLHSYGRSGWREFHDEGMGLFHRGRRGCYGELGDDAHVRWYAGYLRPFGESDDLDFQDAERGGFVDDSVC